MSASRFLPAAIVVALTVTACAAEKAGSPPAASPGKSSDSLQRTQQPASAGYASPPPMPTGKQPTSSEASPGRERADSAWFELQQARGELDATTGDCALACKALASMDRATSHVCGVAPEDAHCGNARETLKTARRRVRAECMACPNGVSVDPDAPIPSAAP
jgi:hypothetical protein